MSSPSAPGVSMKPIEVPKALQEGDKFIKWDEDSGAGLPVTLRVDPQGFFLYWTDQNMEVELLEMATVRDVRTGPYAKVPKDSKIRNIVMIGSQGSLEDKTVTVCHGTDFVNVTFINFCCAKKEIAQMWTEELFALAYNLNQLNCSALRCLEKLHAKITLRADKSGKIPVKNVVRLFAANKEDKRRVEKALGAAGLPSGKGDAIALAKFAFEDFFTFYKYLTQRDEVTAIFNKLTEGKPVLSAAGLVEFLNDVQRDPRLNEILHPYADLPRAADLLARHEPNPCRVQRDQLSADGFLRFLMSEDNPAVAAAQLDADDLEQPLAHYFINSSHNTYLTGHQITGKSGAEIYRQALLAGCRCVELDFWNGRTDEPVVVHGYTFVPEVGARDVLEAIAESAFKTSDLPVILSFENHCNPRQQAKIAAYCRELFGDLLLDRPLESHPLTAGGELPPPSLLRRKIIIKNKKKHHHHKRSPTPTSAPAASPGGSPPRLPRQPSSDSSSSDSSSGEEEAEASPAAGAAADERETHAGAELSALVNYVQPVHFSSFENAEKKNRFYEMSSFDEKQATTLLKERPVEFVNYNKHQLSRVYPAGTRFDSSNFMPQVFWNAGCQLVALNYQTLDLAMQLNLGAFEYGRRCGYLLKPEFMRRQDRRLDPFAESTVDGIIAGSLAVAVLSGQLMSERRVGSYVEVELFGLPADTVRKRFRTRTVPANGINPVYGDEPFVFKKVVLPELALLRLAAHEEGGRLLGHRVLPLRGLCPGYRHVPLRSELGLPLPATLLLHVTVKDYVPDQLSELAEALANPIKYQSELDRREQQLRVLTEGTDAPPEPAEPAPAAPATAPAAPAAPEPAPGAAPGTAPGTAPGAAPPDTDEAELEALLACSKARDKRAELARKLELLRRKHAGAGAGAGAQPAKFYVPQRLVKRLSNKNVLAAGAGGCGGGGGGGGGGGAEGEGAALQEAERALRLRYHHDIHAALERQLATAAQAQVKALQEQLEGERKAVLARLAEQRRDDVKALRARAPRDKDELTRIKREIHAHSVERGVAECGRLEAQYALRREALARRHERARELLQRRRQRDLADLERQCTGAQH